MEYFIIDKLDKRYCVSIKRTEDYYCFIGDREDYSVYADNHNESLSLAICLTIAKVLDLL